MTVQLLTIEQGTKPIRFTELGRGNEGIVATIRPGDSAALARAIDMVNTYGGPNMWRVEEVDQEHAIAPDSGRNVRCTCGAEYSLMSNLRRHIADGNSTELPETAGYAHASRILAALA